MGTQTFLYKNLSHVGNLNNMRLSGKLCDVTIKVNDRKFQAHKLILAANLSYFESMFLNDFQESKQDFTMQGVRGTDLEAFITYAYTGEILVTDTNALNLLEMANYLTEDGIKEFCIEFLKENLKKEEACQAYNLANVIECSSLKSVAKQTILSNLSDCSLTAEYLSLDAKSLEDIFSFTNLHFAQSRQVFFEGVMRWILHDPTSRGACITDLMHLIDITKLSADYLWKYFSMNTDEQGCSYIIKDIMCLYKTQSQQSLQIENLRQKLMIVGDINNKLHIQFYNFKEKKWSQPGEISKSNKSWYSELAISCSACYQISSEGSGLNLRDYLQVFDPVTQQYKMLSSSSSLSRTSTICIIAEMLYMCGGLTRHNSCLNQVLRYDTRSTSFKAITPMKTERGFAAAIFYQGCLHVMGGFNDIDELDSVEKYDLDTEEWTALPSMNRKRYNFGVAILDGKLYACGGGNSFKSVEVYDPVKNSWQLVADMNRGRYKFLVVAHEGKLLAIGGDMEKTVEVYDPSKNQWQLDDELSLELQIKHPQGGLISSMI